ncbi:MAG: type II toxin-antitoxin system RelE/ParE family toxin [Candidatus Bipolaricaulia bacterium]
MARYSLHSRKSVAKDLRAIPKEDVKRMLTRIDSLADEPRPPGCEKLKAREVYRIRQGRYHILYEIREDILVVIVVKIGHRADVYR